MCALLYDLPAIHRHNAIRNARGTHAMDDDHGGDVPCNGREFPIHLRFLQRINGAGGLV